MSATGTELERRAEEEQARYELRRRVYARVANELFEMGLTDSDLVVEVGAVDGGFDFYMRAEEEWRGLYLPVLPKETDFGGINLDEWAPRLGASFFVSIDALSSLRTPFSLMAMLRARAGKGVVVVVPNPEAMPDRERTIVTAISVDDFTRHEWEAKVESLAGHANDSIIARAPGSGLEV